MADSSDALRRWLGVFCLGMAAGMLIWGQTVLKSKLHGLLFIIYWLVCFIFTVGAIFIALLDIRSLRQRTREEQQELMQKTFRGLPEPPDDDRSGSQ